MRFGAWAGLALALTLGGGFASTSKAELITPPPPIEVDQLAPYVKATTKISWRGSDAKIEFLADGDYALLRGISPIFPVPQVMPVRSPSEALLILSDKRLAPLWPALLEWAGADLVKLRDRQIALALEAYQQGGNGAPANTTAESTVEPKTAAFLQYLSVLTKSGQEKQAMILIDAEIARRYQPKKKMSLDTSMLILRKSTLMAFEGNVSGAATYLQGILKTAKMDDKWRTNINVNLAAFLAESGQYQAALELVEPTQQKFIDQTYSGSVPGSDRQFAWIRACALHGLGRTSEAKAAMAVVEAAPETINDDFYVISPTPEIVGRAAVCVQDKERIIALNFQYYAEDYLVSGTHVAVQRDFDKLTRNQEFIRSIYGDPRLKVLSAERMRTLPEELQPALNEWR